MPHSRVGDDLTDQVSHDLMDVDDDETRLVHLEALGLHVGVDDAELPCPVDPDGSVTALTAALQRVRPVDVFVHESESGLDVTGVEGVVGSSKEPLGVGHSAFAIRSSEP